MNNNQQPRSFMMFSTYLGKNKFKKILAAASASLLVACSAVGAAGSEQAAPVPTLSVPDFTQVVAETEGSVVNIRTTEAVPVRSNRMGPNSNNPSELFRWFFGYRTSVVVGKRESVRVDRVGRRLVEKKHRKYLDRLSR